MPADNPLRERALEIQRAADRGANLTRQLLAFSRRQIIEPQVLDLNHAIRGISQMLRRVISRKIEILIRTETEQALITGDPGQIEQVLVNLALNARDAMPDGGVLTISTSVMELSASAAAKDNVGPGRYVRLQFSDTGCGMDEEIRSRIFEPFFTTKQGQGTGLGLSIVYGIVQQCGGNISVRSQPGKGSDFIILFPAPQ
jgi:signal transduction histidine kinase